MISFIVSSKRCVGYFVTKEGSSYKFSFLEEDMTTQEYISRILKKVFDVLYFDTNTKLNNLRITIYTGFFLLNPLISITVAVISYVVRSQTLHYKHIYTVSETKVLFKQKQEEMIKKMIQVNEILESLNHYTCLYGDANSVEFRDGPPVLTFISLELVLCHVLEQYFKPLRHFVNLTANYESASNILDENNYHRDIIEDFHKPSDLKRFAIINEKINEDKCRSNSINVLDQSLRSTSHNNSTYKSLIELSNELIVSCAEHNNPINLERKETSRVGIYKVFSLLKKLDTLRTTFYDSFSPKILHNIKTDQFNRYSCFIVRS
jgi:hypothetical protein